MDLHHWYHLYADGEWEVPVADHLRALDATGLLAELASLHIGFVGSPTNVERAKEALGGLEYSIAAEVETGWEQETLDDLYDFSKDNDGAVLYAHTKGSAHFKPVNLPWRRSMEYFNVIGWRTAVDALESGKAIVGCHWIKGNPTVERLNAAWKNRELNPPGLDGVGGMFGGNYWWTRLELLRQNCRPTRESRFAAEHWLGQLSEVMPIWDGTICDLNPKPIADQFLVTEW